MDHGPATVTGGTRKVRAHSTFFKPKVQAVDII